jgi:hypothetical protein
VLDCAREWEVWAQGVLGPQGDEACVLFCYLVGVVLAGLLNEAVQACILSTTLWVCGCDNRLGWSMASRVFAKDDDKVDDVVNRASVSATNPDRRETVTGSGRVECHVQRLLRHA